MSSGRAADKRGKFDAVITSRPASPISAIAMLLAPLPALVVGVLVMRRSGVSATVWGQQLGAGLVLMAFVAVMRLAVRVHTSSRPSTTAIVGVGAMLLLIATFAHSGVDGIHRWVSLGPLQLHAAFIALPALLVALCATVRRDSVGGASWLSKCAAITAALVLLLQPDASQATAFAIALAVVLLQRGHPHASDWIAVVIVAVCALLAWFRPDPLAPVPHVEGIVSLAASLSTVWWIASLIALVLLPLPFILVASRRLELQAEGFSLAAYFGAACVAPFVGAYPVPILGYGLSPILGYFGALGWIILRVGAPSAET